MSKERVVCIDSNLDKSIACKSSPSPIKGEIYTINYTEEKINGTYYGFEEMQQDECFHSRFFRPVDDSFGEYVESTLMKEVEYSEALKEMTI